VATAAEEWTCSFRTSGLVKGDLSLVYLVDGTSTAAPSWTLAARSGSDGWYHYWIAGFPDADPGATTEYSASITAADGTLCSHDWPSEPQAAQPLVYNPTFDVPPGSRFVAVGDLLPWFDLLVTGLASDPTGATVEFTLYDINTGEAVESITDATAEIVAGSAESYTVQPSGVTAWRATLRYRWTDGDTDTAGDYYGRWRVTFAASTCGPDEDEPCRLTLPTQRQAQVSIVP
jgi:hypothetical protein